MRSVRVDEQAVAVEALDVVALVGRAVAPDVDAVLAHRLHEHRPGDGAAERRRVEVALARRSGCGTRRTGARRGPRGRAPPGSRRARRPRRRTGAPCRGPRRSSGSSYWPRSAVKAYGIAPCSRIHASAQQVSSPPEKAMPTRSPTGSEPRIDAAARAIDVSLEVARRRSSASSAPLEPSRAATKIVLSPAIVPATSGEAGRVDRVGERGGEPARRVDHEQVAGGREPARPSGAAPRSARRGGAGRRRPAARRRAGRRRSAP